MIDEKLKELDCILDLETVARIYFMMSVEDWIVEFYLLIQDTRAGWYAEDEEVPLKFYRTPSVNIEGNRDGGYFLFTCGEKKKKCKKFNTAIK